MVFLITLLSIALLTASEAGAAEITQPDSLELVRPQPLEILLPRPVEIAFPSADGGVVDALVYGQSQDVLVLVHGAQFAKESWKQQAPVFANAGFQVFAIDLRGHGKTKGGPMDASQRNIHLDVLATVYYAKAHGARSVSVLGASLGGWAAGRSAVDAAAGEIACVILLAATPVQHPENMQGHKLFIVGRGDLTGSGRQRLETVQNQYQRASDPKKLLVIDSEAHAQFLFETDHGQELMQAILYFLEQCKSPLKTQSNENSREETSNPSPQG